jgi:uncharacterized membrane protein
MLLDEMLALALPKDLIVVLIGTLPIFELRGALPVAINLFGFPWYYALFLSILGNMLPVPFLLLFWDGISNFLARIGIFQRYLKWLFQRTRRQSFNIAKYKFIGLLVFVAVPVPFTGAWTASLVAIVLGMKFWPAFWSIFGGVIVAGVIVMALSLLGWLGAVIAVIGLAAVTAWSLWKNKSPPAEAKPLQDRVKY